MRPGSRLRAAWDPELLSHLNKVAGGADVVDLGQLLGGDTSIPGGNAPQCVASANDIDFHLAVRVVGFVKLESRFDQISPNTSLLVVGHE